MDNIHRAEIKTLSWKDVRKEVAALKPSFAKLVDSLSPGPEFKIFKARYPFGTKIIDDGELQLPTANGDVESIKSQNVATEIKENLIRRNLPASLVIKKPTEIYCEMPDRIISRYILEPGCFFGVWGNLDALHSEYVKWIWSLASGARSLYLLPKVTNIASHKQLRRKYGVTVHIPRSYSDQWEIFVEIANSNAFDEEWYSEVLFFSDKWLDTALSDPAWKELHHYLLQMAWRESGYWRNKGTFELIWEKFVCDVLDRNIRPNLYLACIVKQLILTGVSILPGYSIADENNSVAPITGLQKVYLEDYKLKDFVPIFMCPHVFSFEDEYPTYYSLQHPNLLDSVPISHNLRSVLSAIPEISFLMEAFSKKTIQGCIAENTPIDKFCKDVACTYFHYNEEKWNDILPTSQMPLEDKRLLITPKGYSNDRFPETANFIRGCVSFRSKNTTHKP